MTASIHRWGIALFAALLGICLYAPAARADWDLGGRSDEQFVTDYFGTTLLMVTSTQLVDPMQGYWADKLPAQLSSNQDYLVGVINAGRVSKNQPMLDASTYPIVLGWETALENGKFQYHIDFTGIRPSEVAAVIATLGGESKVLPGATFSVKPLASGYFSGYSTGSTTVSLPIGSQSIDINVAQSIDAVRKQLADMLNKRFGKEVYFSLSITQDYNYDNVGTINSSIYLTINLDGPVAPLEGEGGE